MGNSSTKNEECEDCFRRRLIHNIPWPNKEETLIGIREERDQSIIENTKLKAENEKLKEDQKEYKSRLNYVSNILEK